MHKRQSSIMRGKKSKKLKIMIVLLFFAETLSELHIFFIRASAWKHSTNIKRQQSEHWIFGKSTDIRYPMCD